MPAACTGMPHAVLQRWADLRAQFSLFYITLAAPSQGHYHFNNSGGQEGISNMISNIVLLIH